MSDFLHRDTQSARNRPVVYFQAELRRRDGGRSRTRRGSIPMQQRQKISPLVFDAAAAYITHNAAQFNPLENTHALKQSSQMVKYRSFIAVLPTLVPRHTWRPAGGATADSLQQTRFVWDTCGRIRALLWKPPQEMIKLRQRDNKQHILKIKQPLTGGSAFTST